jgi:hypothetical protein
MALTYMFHRFTYSNGNFIDIFIRICNDIFGTFIH